MKIILGLLTLSFALSATPIAGGKLVLAKPLEAKAKGIRTVFIALYDPSSPRPLPCAAQKFTIDKDAKGEFLKFTLDTNQLMMMGCTEIPTHFNLKAKLDRDGSAGPDAAGDLIGKMADVKKGNLALSFTIDTAK